MPGVFCYLKDYNMRCVNDGSCAIIVSHKETRKVDKMEKDKYLLASVDNTLKILELLSHHSALSLAEITKLTDFDKSSIFRMLYTLTENQLIEKTEDGKYQLGIKLLYYASKVLAKQDIITVAKPYMKEMVAMENIPVHLGKLTNNKIVTIHIEDEVVGPHVTGKAGMTASAHTTAMGRVCLSHLSHDELAKILDNIKFKKYSERSILNVSELEALIQEVRVNGYGIDLDDRYPGFGAVAVPIFDYTGICVAALGVVATSQTIRQSKEEYVRVLWDTAEKISESLGYKK